MILVGIDVAKSKHDCVIINSNGEILAHSFTIPNSMGGFEALYSKILCCSVDDPEIKIGLEATGHYNNIISVFLINKNLPIFLINPLHTSFYRKSQSFRKTKADKADAHTICSMIQTQKLTPYVPVSYHSQELKSLTRYRFLLVEDSTRIKVSFSRMMTIIFPELQPIVKDIQVNSVYALIHVLPSANAIATCHLTKLTNILKSNSKGHYNKEKAKEIRDAACTSVGTCSPMQSLELTQTIKRLQLIRQQLCHVEIK